MNFTPSKLRIGILGAGQLGKMMAQEASKLDIELRFLDKSKDYPAGKLSRFMEIGDFRNYDDVLRFGSSCDVIGIEIEDVNLDALKELKSRGKRIVPDPDILEMIQDKGLQKQYLMANGFPTSSFFLLDGADSVKNAVDQKMFSFPFVQKARKGGYDGKGVAIIRNEEDWSKLMDLPCVIEPLADIAKELSVITINSSEGQHAAYPCVEMEFHPEANLVEYLLCPAAITNDEEARAVQLVMELSEHLEIEGLLAVELFLLKNGTIWINELAPRPHNSGHHTLDHGACSQFENQVRVLAGLPIGAVQGRGYAIMVNLIGEEGHMGPVCYQGMEQCIEIPGVRVHLYGKSETRPHRKMGHVCIVGSDLDSCRKNANFVRRTLKVVT